MPATVGAAGSSVRDFDVTRRLVAGPGRANVLRVPLAVAFVALTTLDVGLGLFPPINRERLPDIIGLLELPAAPRRTNRLSLPVSISSRLAAFFLPAAFFTVAFLPFQFSCSPPCNLGARR
jgi:hypothetical protein